MPCITVWQTLLVGCELICQSSISDRYPCMTTNLDLVETLSAYYTQSPYALRPPPAPLSHQEGDHPLEDRYFEDKEDIFYTPPSSPSASSPLAPMNYPPWIVFIHGSSPSCDDFEVYQALKNVDVDSDYRYVISWRSAMEMQVREAELREAFQKLAI